MLWIFGFYGDDTIQCLNALELVELSFSGNSSVSFFDRLLAEYI